MRSFNSNKNQQRQKEHWRQLALWLWETHNHISTKIDTISTTTATSSFSQAEQDTENILWPPDSICKECKFSNGWEWDKDSVYEYLKSEYWPSGTQQFRYVVLNSDPLDFSSSDNTINTNGTNTTMSYLNQDSSLSSSQANEKKRKRVRRKKQKKKLKYLFYAAGLCLCYFILNYLRRRHFLHRTGRHKKFDSEFLPIQR